MRARLSAACLAALGVGALAACSDAPDDAAARGVLGDDTVTVASFDFPESELLAEIYGQALTAEGYDVDLALDAGPRELVQPALAAGLVEFVPEYAGTSLVWLSLGDDQPSDDVGATTAALERLLADRRIVPLAPAPAQDANAVVVTREVADLYGLETISDLAAHAPALTFGGPPGCKNRPHCLAGLADTYGLEFADFLPLDVGGPLTHQALVGGFADVGLLFTTDPRLADDDLVVLADDKGLQPAENVVPMVRQEVLDRWGDGFAAVVDGVSARLTTPILLELNQRVADGESPRAVAAAWLAAEGLT
jgi:osmoprotectant transport system substrate-binding protein